MSNQGFQQTLIVAQVAGPSVNAAANTSILPPAAIYTFPSNYFLVGSTIRISARGTLTSNTSGAAGTLAIVPQLGGANLFASSTMALTAALTNETWEFECVATCRAIGNSTVGSFIAIGSFFASGGVLANTFLPPTAPAAISTFNTTGTLALDLQAVFSVGTASESIVLQHYLVESLN